MSTSQSEPSFFGRLQIATSGFFRVLGDAGVAVRVARALQGPSGPSVSPQPVVAPAPAPTPAPAPVIKVEPPPPVVLPPERVHASGLAVLALLQREGRFIDFLQEDLAAYPDADIGAAARAVHTGCRKVLSQCLTLEPVLRESEGSTVSVPTGFDAQRIRLTGNITGNGPFRGEVRHHGWVTTAVRMPVISESLDARVLAPAEVELP